MYPRISDLINDILGTNLDIPIQSYGFFVAMAFIAAALVLRHELKRKEHNGLIKPTKKKIVTGKPASFAEIAFSAVLGYIIGFKGSGIILDYALFSQNPQEYLMSGQGYFVGGVLIALLAGASTWYEKHRKRKPEPEEEEVNVHPYQLVSTLVLIAAISGIMGAKIFSLAEHFNEFLEEPVASFFSFSGLNFYGGLVVAAVVLAIYAERKNIPWPVLGDAVAPALILAYAVGRIGCQTAGDGCWGIVNTMPKPEWLAFLPDWMWAFDYPHNVINEGVRMEGCTGDHCYHLAQPVFPTPFYETVMGLILFTVLWSIRKRFAAPGMIFSIYLMMNGVERFLIEKIRVNPRYDFLGMHPTQAEVIAVIIFTIGLLGLWYFRYRYRKKQKNTTDGKTGTEDETGM
ncbi:MAG: prolipoprotein diacylglyceryl transferase [Bacteroidales bacterium]|nr:prolipoprotein diacylglyceryl transferase [Bacteroidales bacterium]